MISGNEIIELYFIFTANVLKGKCFSKNHRKSSTTKYQDKKRLQVESLLHFGLYKDHFFSKNRFVAYTKMWRMRSNE